MHDVKHLSYIITSTVFIIIIWRNTFIKYPSKVYDRLSSRGRSYNYATKTRNTILIRIRKILIYQLSIFIWPPYNFGSQTVLT